MRPLVVDPVLSYATYFGGIGFEGLLSMSLDANGSLYCCGWTSSPGFPTYAGFQNTYQGDPADAWLAKLLPDGLGSASRSRAPRVALTSNDSPSLPAVCVSR